MSKRVKSIPDSCFDFVILKNNLFYMHYRSSWRKRYAPAGEKTQFASMEEENRALKLELSETKMERDMLKKAAAYFAKNQK